MTENLKNEKLQKVSDVDIDPNGKFKYILLNVVDPQSKDFKHIVRGYSRCGFHDDILGEVEPSIIQAGLTCDCTGGGRILHSSADKTLKVYGYSQGYGKADHAMACTVLKRAYADYKSITWSDDGY